MPLEEAMRTQRSIRRLRADPVDHDLLLHCVELALKAPTGSNSQGWEFVLVEDRTSVGAIGRLNGFAWRLYGPVGRRQYRRNEQMQRILAAVQHQADNYDDIPALVVPCVRVPFSIPFVIGPVLGASALYGSVYPSIQNFLLACRAAGLGACLTTLPLWNVRRVRKILGLPRGLLPVAVIPVGWPEGRYGPTTRRPVKEVVHLDRFGNRPFL
ncbi:MAG: nitroreductase family protein [Acidimicrobiia bacterium]|nr:nitroreductase family protein [Acidimicrobiia bacterium]